MISPSITIDSDGKPVVVFGAVPKNQKSTLLEDVLSIPAKIAQRYPQKQLVVIFDEFPQIRSFESDRAERVLRSVIQHHEEIAYIFCGSRKHMIREMFLNKTSPLYRSAAHYPVGYISIIHWISFINERFSSGEKSITDECIDKIFSETEGHPFYTQMLCSVCYEISEKKLVLALAKEKEIESPYSTEIIQKHSLSPASTVQRTIKKLTDADVIDRNEYGKYHIADKFFSRWIVKKMGSGN